MSSYEVYLAEYLGLPRNHHAIFVQTESDGNGYIFQVTGTIQDGMVYESKPGKKPDESLSFVSKSFLGYVEINNYERINEICGSIPPPKKQFDGQRRINKREPLRRCQEWTGEAIGALQGSGIIVSSFGGTSSGGTSSAVQRDYWTWSPEHNLHYHKHQDGSYTWENSGSGSRGPRR
jgi:hypothetical protein